MDNYDKNLKDINKEIEEELNKYNEISEEKKRKNFFSFQFLLTLCLVIFAITRLIKPFFA